MKQKLLLILASCAAAFIAYAAIEPSAITISVSFTGTPSPSDIRTSKYVIAKENSRRLASSTNATVLPSGTPAEIKSSVLTVLTKIATDYMIDNAVLADEESTVKLTAEQVRDIHRAVTDRINSGMTADQVITLIKP